MADIAWPEGLSAEFLRDSAAMLPPANLEQSEMQRGVKLRRVSTGTPWEYSLTLHYKTPAEYNIFEDHILNTVRGQRFAFPDPDDSDGFLSCRIIPQEGRAFIPERRVGGVRRANIQMAVYKS